jgi:hypothetical protein
MAQSHMGAWEQMLGSLETFHEHQDNEQSAIISAFTKTIHDSNNGPPTIPNHKHFLDQLNMELRIAGKNEVSSETMIASFQRYKMFALYFCFTYI